MVHCGTKVSVWERGGGVCVFVHNKVTWALPHGRNSPTLYPLLCCNNIPVQNLAQNHTIPLSPWTRLRNSLFQCQSYPPPPPPTTTTTHTHTHLLFDHNVYSCKVSQNHTDLTFSSQTILHARSPEKQYYSNWL